MSSEHLTTPEQLDELPEGAVVRLVYPKEHWPWTKFLDGWQPGLNVRSLANSVDADRVLAYGPVYLSST